MKTVHTYVCLVDEYRNGTVFRGKNERLYDRNTKGRYLVGAKSEAEAKKLLRAAVQFGSIDVYYRATDDNGEIKKGYEESDRKMGYKEIVKVKFVKHDEKWSVCFSTPRKATDPVR